GEVQQTIPPLIRPEEKGLMEIILWSNPDHFIVEEDQLKVELTASTPRNLTTARHLESGISSANHKEFQKSDSRPNLARRISNETQCYVNHHVSALDSAHDTSRNGRHSTRDIAGRRRERIWRSHLRRLALRHAGARRTAIRVRYHAPRWALCGGHVRPSHEG